MATHYQSTLNSNRLNLSVQTWQDSKGITYAIFNDANGTELKRTFGGYAPNQFYTADKFARDISMLTGAARWEHEITCDRRHRIASAKCNGNYNNAESVELLRTLTSK